MHLGPEGVSYLFRRRCGDGGSIILDTFGRDKAFGFAILASLATHTSAEYYIA